MLAVGNFFYGTRQLARDSCILKGDSNSKSGRTSEFVSVAELLSALLLSSGSHSSSASVVCSLSKLSSSLSVYSSEFTWLKSSESPASVLPDSPPLLFSNLLIWYSSPLLVAVSLAESQFFFDAPPSVPPLSVVYLEHCDGVFISPVLSALLASNSALAFCAVYLQTHRVVQRYEHSLKNWNWRGCRLLFMLLCILNRSQKTASIVKLRNMEISILFTNRTYPRRQKCTQSKLRRIDTRHARTL